MKSLKGTKTHENLKAAFAESDEKRQGRQKEKTDEESL
jgi:hypothetical protein